MRLLLYILIAAFIGTCSSAPPLLDQVLETGELRVVTRNSPTSYTTGPDGASGPEYDLVRRFANELGVELHIDTVDNVSEILPMLMSGQSHMAAAGLSITDSRREFLNFSHPYDTVDMHLIYKLGTGKPRSIEEIIGKSIEVLAGSSHADMMDALSEVYPELEWRENADVEIADLLGRVANGKLDYTIADSSDFMIQRHFYPDVRVAIDLQVGEPIAWAFPRNTGDALLARADEFLIQSDRAGLLAQLHERYYGHTRKFDYVGTRNFIRHYKSRLPRYRRMFEQAGRKWGVDWRLLAAIGYQESHWRSGAVSPTGVRGIMMLTNATAEYLGLEDRTDPHSSIFGGAEFYSLQTEWVADSVEEPDRTWMALAAYNVGVNHVKDARKITEWQGGNPDLWIDLSKSLPLLSQRKWYSRVPYGYARGWEPVLYVNNIRSYYNILKWLTSGERIPEIKDEEMQELAPEAIELLGEPVEQV